METIQKVEMSKVQSHLEMSQEVKIEKVDNRCDLPQFSF